MHRPLSFTKNLGGFENLHAAIRSAYRPGTTLQEFYKRIPVDLENRRLVIIQFFLATRVIGRAEYIVDDALVQTTLAEEYDVTLARLYLFAMLLNMPGQRLNADYQSTAPAQNEYARTILHDGVGWKQAALDVDRAIIPWVRQHVSVQGSLRKFATNLAYFFEQAQFDVDASGRLITYANHWGPLALRLFFDRYTVGRQGTDVHELVSAASLREIHKLLGLPVAWLESVIDGAAMAYLSPQRYRLIGTQESQNERQTLPSGPAGRRTALVSRLVRATKNKLDLEVWYRRHCQICGKQVMGSQGQPTIDYAHIRPLGAPHDGPDGIENMLSLCPNHHRQLDRGGITIDPDNLRILAPHGSWPEPRAALLTNDAHQISLASLKFHRDRLFNCERD